MDECHLKARLPGTFFRRKQRWWWRVRLPGENRIRSRSLRPEGDQCGTKSRETAETLALDLWQQALVAETEARIRLETRHQAEEKARAYADLVERLSTRARRLIARQASAAKIPRPQLRYPSHDRPKPSKPRPSGPKPKKQVVKAPSSPTIDATDSNHETSIVVTAQCDCCATPYIPKVELSLIESGQNLCSKCMYYLRDAGHRQNRHQLDSSLI